MNWDDLRFFLAVARAGSLSGASRQLGASPATVWRRIAALEADLDKQLFEHRQRGYVLSPSGTRLLQAVESMEGALFAATRRLEPDESVIEGEVRVTAPELLGVTIAENLSRFHAAYPRLHIELVTASPAATLSRRETDIALRFERPAHTHFVVEAKFRVAFGVYASTRYVERWGKPPTLNNFTGHALIDFDDSAGHVAPIPWLRHGGKKATVVFRSSSLYPRIAAVQAGLGLALLPCILADREPSLMRIFSPVEVGNLELLLVVNGDLQRDPRVSAVRDFLIQVLHGVCQQEKPKRGRRDG